MHNLPQLRKIIRPTAVNVEGAVQIPDAVYKPKETQKPNPLNVNSEDLELDEIELSIRAVLKDVSIDNGERARLAGILRKSCEGIISSATREAEKIRSESAKSAEEKFGMINQTAEQMKDSAKMQAQQILNDAHSKAEVILEKARAEGFSQGVEEKSEQINSCIAAIIAGLDELKRDALDCERVYIKQLVSTAAEISSKLVYKRIEENDEELFELCMQAVKSARGSENPALMVSDKLKGLVDKLISSLGDRIEVQTISGADDGTVLVKCDDKTIDASLLTQIANIKTFFEVNETEAEDNDR